MGKHCLVSPSYVLSVLKLLSLDYFVPCIMYITVQVAIWHKILKTRLTQHDLVQWTSLDYMDHVLLLSQPSAERSLFFITTFCPRRLLSLSLIFTCNLYLDSSNRPQYNSRYSAQCTHSQLPIIHMHLQNKMAN
jgi:hypothetical protein